MTMSAVVTKSLSMGGVAFTESASLAGEGVLAQSLSLPAGKAGSLSTRTSGTAGVLTLSSGHGFVADDRVDIYWEGGICRGASVDSVTETSATFSGGSGAVLPVITTEIVAAKPEVLQMRISGDEIIAIFLASASAGLFVFIDATDAEALVKEVGEGCVWSWREDAGEDNPVSGDTLSKVYISSGETNVVEMKLGILYNNA